MSDVHVVVLLLESNGWLDNNLMDFRRKREEKKRQREDAPIHSLIINPLERTMMCDEKCEIVVVK